MVRTRDLGVTGLVVTHDMRSAFFVGDRIAMLYEGRIRQVGSRAEIQATDDPVVRQFIEGRPGEEEEAEREVLVRTIDQVREAFVAAGGDPAPAHFQIGAKVRRNAAGDADEDHLQRRIEGHWEIGMTQVQVSLADLVHSPDDVRPFLERIAVAYTLRPAVSAP